SHALQNAIPPAKCPREWALLRPSIPANRTLRDREGLTNEFGPRSRSDLRRNFLRTCWPRNLHSAPTVMKTRAQALSRTESTPPRFSWRYDMSAPFQRVASRRPPFSLLTFLILASSSI